MKVFHGTLYLELVPALHTPQQHFRNISLSIPRQGSDVISLTVKTPAFMNVAQGLADD
jgi:hypothetical protein